MRFLIALEISLWMGLAVYAAHVHGPHPYVAPAPRMSQFDKDMLKFAPSCSMKLAVARTSTDSLAVLGEKVLRGRDCAYALSLRQTL